MISYGSKKKEQGGYLYNKVSERVLTLGGKKTKKQTGRAYIAVIKRIDKK